MCVYVCVCARLWLHLVLLWNGEKTDDRGKTSPKPNTFMTNDRKFTSRWHVAERADSICELVAEMWKSSSSYYCLVCDLVFFVPFKRWFVSGSVVSDFHALFPKLKDLRPSGQTASLDHRSVCGWTRGLVSVGFIDLWLVDRFNNNNNNNNNKYLFRVKTKCCTTKINQHKRLNSKSQHT